MLINLIVHSSLARGGTFASVGIPPTTFDMKVTVWSHIMNGRTYLGAVMGGCIPQMFIPNIINVRTGRLIVEVVVVLVS